MGRASLCSSYQSRISDQRVGHKPKNSIRLYLKYLFGAEENRRLRPEKKRKQQEALQEEDHKGRGTTRLPLSEPPHVFLCECFNCVYRLLFPHPSILLHSSFILSIRYICLPHIHLWPTLYIYIYYFLVKSSLVPFFIAIFRKNGKLLFYFVDKKLLAHLGDAF